jgi:hypothetical protein
MNTLTETLNNEDTVRPPPLLEKLLNFARDQQQESTDNYDDFLLYSERAANLCRSSSILIEATYKLATPFIPITAKSIKLPLEDEQHSGSVGGDSRSRKSGMMDDNKTNTLIMIFNFYSKIKFSFQQTTFTADDIANSTLSFQKTELFCKDFNIIPKLLTRDDLKFIWEDLANAHFEKGLGQFKDAEFSSFKDLIVRMAIWAYQKPGLKKLIVTIEGFLPKPVEVVKCFCTFLHLHDTEYVMNFLRNIAKQTEDDANFRLHGGMSEQMRLEMRIARDLQKVEQLKKTTVGKLHSPPESPKSRLNKACNKFNQFKEDTEELDQQSLLNQSVGFQRSVNSYAKTDVFGDKLRGQVITDPANPIGVVKKRSERQSMTWQNSLRYPEESRKKSLLPESMQERLTPGYYALVASTGAEDEEQGFTQNAPESHHGDKAKQQLVGIATSSPLGRSSTTRNYGGYNDDDDDEDISLSVGPSVLSKFQDNSIYAMREAVAKYYDARLVLELAQYCYIAPKVIISDWIPTHGPFVDLGLLDGGSKVTIQLRVSNGTPDELYIDATSRNFRSEDTNIKTLAKPLIPGFARNIFIEFTVPKRDCTVLCYIDVINIAVRKGESALISCPVFYRVDANASHDGFPKCTAGRLPDLLGTKIPGRTRQFTATFDQRKAIDGSWSNVRTKSLRLTPLQLTASRPNTSHN